MNLIVWLGQLTTFFQMYGHITEEMVDANVATPFETPRWMDKAENVVKEEQSFG